MTRHVPPLVAVWPHAKVPGWRGPVDAGSTAAYPTVALTSALTTQHDTDAHMTPYVVVEGDDAVRQQPRLKTGARRFIEAKGARIECRAVIVDVDRPNHEQWESLEQATQAIEALLEAYGDEGQPLENAGIYTTRAGYRLVYIPETPIPVAKFKAVMGNPPTTRQPARGFLGWLYEATDGKVFADEVSNQWMRSYRLPHVVRDGERTKTYIDITYMQPTSFAQWMQAASEESAGVSVEDYVSKTRPVEPAPMTPEDWQATELATLLRTRWRGLYGTLKKGKPFFKSGERNTKTFGAVSLVAELCTDASNEAPTAEKLYRMFVSSTLAAVREGITQTDADVCLSELWDICERRAAAERTRLAEKTKADETRDENTATLAKATRISGSRDAFGRPFEDGLPVILVHGNAYYVLDLRRGIDKPTYYPPTKNAAMLPRLLIEGCAGVINVDVMNDRGTAYRSTTEILADYAYPIAKVIRIISGDASEIPLVIGTTVRIPSARRIDVEAHHHRDVQEWLERLGGVDAEALLDWCATVTDLSRPTAALYFEGRRGAGKGMFAAAIASLWGEAAVGFEESVRNFNDALARSPVVFLDEGINQTRLPSSVVSSAFRSLVAETTRRIEPKGLPSETLEGAVRVIVAANNGEALPLTGQHTAEDIAAVAERILHIDVGEEASHGLAWDRTHDWVWRNHRTPGKIAEHLMWLAAHRKVTNGDRFLVPGRMKPYHEGLALTSTRLEVLAAIAEALGGDIQKAKQAGVIVRDRSVLVNALLLRKRWYELTNERKTPSQAEVTGALQALSGVQSIRRDNRRFYVVPPRHVLAAAHKQQISTDETLRAVIGLDVYDDEDEAFAV